MKHPTLHQVRSLDKVLKSRQHGLYRVMMLRLCQDYSNYSFTSDIARLIKSGDVKALVSLADSLEEQKYSSATDHFVANQFVALIKKYPHPKCEAIFAPQDVAVKKFLKSERKCAQINKKLRLRRNRIGKPQPFFSQIESMRRFIAYVLGAKPNLPEIWSSCNFGPGAAIGVHGNGTGYSRKLLRDTWSVSPSALMYSFAAVMNHAQFREILLPSHEGFSTGSPQEDFRLFVEKIEYTRHNKIAFVPKTVKTLRSIAVEPLLNGFVQKGIDLSMRRRLKRIGIDLSDQTLNQEFARLGSLDSSEDGFVTIDLSSASDSIAIETCRDLLPDDWFYLLDSTRSREYELMGKHYVYHKFVSMGNGFCFPLETLLFVAACHAVGAGRPGVDFQVYGDDIVVRQRFSEPLIELLSYLGFSTNNGKTFLNGPFRESCGTDWFGGEDVRPYILDHSLDSLSSLFKFLNLSRRSNRTSDFFAGVRALIMRQIPTYLRFFRPQKGPADTGIDSTGDEHLTSPLCTYVKNVYAWRCYELASCAVPDRYHERWEYGHLALLYGALSGASSTNPFTLRNIAKAKVRQVTYSGVTSTWLPPLQKHR